LANDVRKAEERYGPVTPYWKAPETRREDYKVKTKVTTAARHLEAMGDQKTIQKNTKHFSTLQEKKTRSREIPGGKKTPGRSRIIRGKMGVSFALTGKKKVWEVTPSTKGRSKVEKKKAQGLL